MTRTKKQILPALHQSGKVRNSDLNEIGEKNYTATILKYANLAVKMPQLETNAKTVVDAINELHAHPGGSTVIPNPPIGGGIQTEQGGILELEQGGTLDPEQGGGTVVGDLYSISIDGDIYNIPSGGSDIKTTVETLYPAGWGSLSKQYTLTVYGITSDSVIWVAPVSDTTANYKNYTAYGVRAISQDTDIITFTCDSIPLYDLRVNICYC